MNLKDFDTALAAFDWQYAHGDDARNERGLAKLYELREIAAEQVSNAHVVLLAAWVTHKLGFGPLSDLEVIRRRLGITADRRPRFLLLTIVAAVLIIATSVIIAIARHV